MRQHAVTTPRRARAGQSGRGRTWLRVCSGLVVLPVWLGWSFGSIGALQSARVAETRQQADVVAAMVRRRLGNLEATGQPVLVRLAGHGCTCTTAADEARWAQALALQPGLRRTVHAPGAPYSTLAFDGDGALLFAGSPAGAGCGGDPVRLLATVLAAGAGSATPFIAPCACRPPRKT